MDQIAYNDYGQTTSIRVGGSTANPLTETFTYDVNNGLLTNQKVKRGSTSLLDLTYNYNRDLSKGSLNGKTGNLTHIIDNLDRNKDRKYEYDALGRLLKAKGGLAAGGSGVANWTQDYTYDRYGNKLTTTKSGITANSQAIPLDGLASQTYNATSNRITTSGTEYDNAGNMTRGKAPDGSLQRFEYDTAGRIKVIKADSGTTLETNTYGTSRERLIKENSTERKYYAWGGSSVLVEYTEASSSTVLSWAKSYIYAGSRLLSTITKSGSSEVTEYQHPDRLGTKLITNATLNTAKSQATLPFGTLIDAETTASTNQKFTSYDRSDTTGLDYAVNRTYNSGQSRFTQVDPIGMASTSPGDPQSLNMFAYVENNPIDLVDPNGLDLKSAIDEAIKLLKNEECSLIVTGRKDGAKQLKKIFARGLIVETRKAPIKGYFDRRGKYKISKWANWNNVEGKELGGLFFFDNRGRSSYKGIFINPNQGSYLVFTGEENEQGDRFAAILKGKNATVLIVLHELAHWFGAKGGDGHGDPLNTSIYVNCLNKPEEKNESTDAPIEPERPIAINYGSRWNPTKSAWAFWYWVSEIRTDSMDPEYDPDWRPPTKPPKLKPPKPKDEPIA